MTEDIVTRLRAGWTKSSPIFVDAADAIEQLREELEESDADFHALKQMFDSMRESRDDWRGVATLLYTSIPEPPTFTQRVAMDVYRKVANSD